MLLLLTLAASAAYAPVPVPDPHLAEMRGGFALPGGLQASMAVRTETSVNGALLLRSVYRLNEGAPSLQVFAPRAGETVRGGAAVEATGRALQGSVNVNFDRQNGFSIARQMTSPVAGLTVASGAAAAQAQATDLPALDLSNGPVETAGGRVSVSDLPQGVRTRIEGDGIDASHLFGGAFGTVVANTANARDIESATTIGLELRGATPLNLGSALLRAESLAADAVRQMVTR